MIMRHPPMDHNPESQLSLPATPPQQPSALTLLTPSCAAVCRALTCGVIIYLAPIARTGKLALPIIKTVTCLHSSTLGNLPPQSGLFFRAVVYSLLDSPHSSLVPRADNPNPGDRGRCRLSRQQCTLGGLTPALPLPICLCDECHRVEGSVQLRSIIVRVCCRLLPESRIVAHLPTAPTPLSLPPTLSDRPACLGPTRETWRP